jgi:hypothetical protein
MDQLFPLGHVSGATKSLELARRGMSLGWFSEEKRAEFAAYTFDSDPSDVRLDEPSSTGFRSLLERQVERSDFTVKRVAHDFGIASMNQITSMSRPRFLPDNFILALIGTLVLASLLPRFSLQVAKPDVHAKANRSAS